MTVRTNLIPNPRAGLDAFAGRVYESDPAGTITADRDATGGPAGTTAWKVAAIPPNTATAGFKMPLLIGAGQYHFQGKVKTDANCTDGALVIRRLDTFELVFNSHTGAGQDWSAKSGTFTVLEAVEIEILMGLSFYGSGNGSAGTCWFSELMLIKDVTTTYPYFDGDTADAGTNAYAWTGATHNSASTWDDAVGSPGGGTALPAGSFYPNGAAPNLAEGTRQSYARALYDRFVAFCFTQTGMAAGMPAGAWRVKVHDQFTDGNSPARNNHTFSEGQAWGMLATAVFSNPGLPTGIYDSTAREKFDGLLKYWKFYDRLSGDETTPRGFMDWRIDDAGNITGTGGATDGDEDAAFALLMMHRIHGSAGTVNYSEEAARIINSMDTWEFTPSTYSPANVMTNGDHWGFGTDHYMPDYFAPAWYREFGSHVGRAARWDAITSANYPLARGYFDTNYTTGMVPDNCLRSGLPKGTESYKYAYNALRSPWRSVADFLFNGSNADPLSKRQADKLVAFGKAKKGTVAYPGGIKAEYTLDGTGFADYHNLAHAQAFLAASLADAAHSDFGAEAFTYLYNQRLEDSYYGLGLATQTAILAAGLLQPHAAATTTPTEPTTPPPSGTEPSTGVAPGHTATPQELSQIQSVYTGIKNQYIRVDGGVKQLEADNKITSEGQAYAAMMAVHFGDKATLDLVESFSINVLERRNWVPGGPDNWRTGSYFDPRTHSPDLMAWNYSNATNTMNDWNYATDADVDRAGALIWAYERGWGENYLTKARTILSQLEQNLHLWNGKRYLSTDEFQTDGRNPFEINISYIDPSKFKQFFRITGNVKWREAHDGMYDMYDRTARTTTGPLATTKGLPPDWNGFNVQTGAVDRIGSRLIKYSYDAFRTHARMYWDWRFNKDTRAPERFAEFANFVTAEWSQFGRFGMEYEHDGSPIGGRYEKTMQYWITWMVLTARNPNDATAAAIKSQKLDNTYLVANNGGYWADGPGNTNRSYFADYWCQIGKMTQTGLWYDWGSGATTPINTVPLAAKEGGTSTDKGSLRLVREIAARERGVGTDTGFLAIPAALSVQDAGTGTDIGDLTVAGSTPTVFLSAVDRGGSADLAALFQAGVTLEALEAGSSTDAASLDVGRDLSIRPVVRPLAEELYESLGPLAKQDQRYGWPLLRFCNALVVTRQVLDDLVRDGEYPGWTSVLDIDRAPVEALPWLAQFIGVSMNVHLDEVSQRLRLRETSGFRRGTRASIEGAARQHLTGGRLVEITERDTSPYHFKVVTYATETPDQNAVAEALLAQKPAGLVMNYTVSSGQTYGQLTATNQTYDQLRATYPTYSAMKVSTPA